MSLFKNPHANQRYFERVHPDIASKNDIVKAIQHPSNIEYIKRLTESRSMAYVHLPNDNVVKVIINKKKKELVTILPWKDVYKVEIICGDYVIYLFPDCYLETKNISTLNKINVRNATSISVGNFEKDWLSVNWEIKEILFNSDEFEKVFYKAWEFYEETKTKTETKEN